ncbi:MAG: hypothetical protein AAFV98_06430 [Chloroflexota bacterium]
MRRGVIVLGLLVAVMIGGGVLTAGVGFELPTIQQTTNPAGSVFGATSSQALDFFLLVGFILFNVVGAGLTIAVIFWFLGRQVRLAKEMPTLEERREQEAEQLAEPSA